MIINGFPGAVNSDPFADAVRRGIDPPVHGLDISSEISVSCGCGFRKQIFEKNFHDYSQNVFKVLKSFCYNDLT